MVQNSRARVGIQYCEKSLSYPCPQSLSSSPQRPTTRLLTPSSLPVLPEMICIYKYILYVYIYIV